MMNEYQFYWRGISQNTTLSGFILAKNAMQVSIHLKHQGIRPLKIRRKYTFLTSWISHIDISIFYRQLNILITSGIPLVQAISALETTQSNQNFKLMLLQIKNSLAAGNSLAHTLLKFPNYFDSFSCHLIHLGEYSGKLEQAISRAAARKEAMIHLKSQLIQALIYPITIAIVAILVTLIMLIFIVPKFASLFQQTHHALPLLTQIVLQVSDFFRHYIGVIILFFFCLLGWCYHFKTYKFLYKLPVIKKLSTKIGLSQFARNLAIISNAGIPLVDGLKLLSNMQPNVLFSKAIYNLYLDISKGIQLHKAMQTHKLFPALTVQMIKVGEESGKLDNMLENIAILYEQEIEQTIRYLKQLLEPLIMIILGVLIGGLVVAMYLPVFKLGTVI